MYQRITLFFLNSDLPATCEGLTEAIRVAMPNFLSTVPYMLKLLAEQQSGIEALRHCDCVLTAGSHFPDDFGSQLVEDGVNLSTVFGRWVHIHLRYSHS